MKSLFDSAFNDLTVLVTGHTGFKGSWLTCWLAQLGAQVVGFSLEQPPTKPSNFEIAGIQRHIIDIRGDIRDLESLKSTIQTYQPTLVFHLAGQVYMTSAVGNARPITDVTMRKRSPVFGIFQDLTQGLQAEPQSADIAGDQGDFGTDLQFVALGQQCRRDSPPIAQRCQVYFYSQTSARSGFARGLENRGGKC